MRPVLQPDGTIGWVMDPPEEDPFAAVSPGLAFTDGQGSELVEDQLPAPPDYPPAAPEFQAAIPEPASTPPPVAEAPSPFSGLLGKAKSWAGSLFDSSAAAKAEAKNTLAAEIERRKRGLQQASDPDPGLMGDSWGIMSPEERHLRTADRAERLPGEIARTKTLRGYADTASDVTLPPLPGVMTPKPLFDLAESFFGTRQDKLAKEQQDLELQKRGLMPMARKTPLRSGAERFAQSGINMVSGGVEGVGNIQGYLLEGAANLGIGKSIGLNENFDPATAPIYQLGHKLRTWTEASFPGDPARQNEVFQNVADGAAQMIALYGPAAALKILGAGEKAALATSAVTGVSMEMPMAFNEATSVMDAERQRLENENGPRPNLGPTELQRLLATIGGAGIGLTEAFPFLHDYSGQIKRTIPRVLGAVGEGMVEEGLIQEPGQTVLENLNARAFYDPNRNPLEGVEDAATAALITGGAAKGGQQIAEEYYRQPAEAPSPFGGLLPPPSGGNLTEDEGIVFEDRDEADTPPPDRIEEPILEERDAPPPVRIAQDEERRTTPFEEVVGQTRTRRAWREAGNAATEYAPPPKEGEDRGEPIPEDEFADLVKISRDFYNQPPAVLQSRSVAPAEAPGATETPPEASARPEPPQGQGGGLTSEGSVARIARGDVLPPTAEELTAAHRAIKQGEVDDLAKAFGGDMSKAKEFDRLLNAADLSPAQEARLVSLRAEASDEPYRSFEDVYALRDLASTYRDLEQNPLEADQIIARYLADIPSNPAATLDIKQAKAMAVLKKAAQVSVEAGVSSKDFSAKVVRRYAGRFSDPEDAKFMVEALRSAMTGQPKRKEAADGRPALDDGRPEADRAQAGDVRQSGRVRGGDELLQEPDARSDATAEEPLRGAPDTVKIPGRGEVKLRPFAKARQAARDYAKAAGIPYKNVTTYATVDKGRAKRVAQAYDEMKHTPQDPKVKAAYRKMIDETVAQYREIEKTGLKIEFIRPDMEDPYAKSPRYAQLDVEENNHLWVFPTDDGFGSDASFDPSDNPLLELTDVTIDGRKLRANDVFRIVHDYFGHFKNAVGFRADGEENAWRAHSAMYSPEARKAMTSETRGQNSWVNYGPNGEANRSASAADTVYADQKVGLLPDWAIEEGAADIEVKPTGASPSQLEMRAEDRAKGKRRAPVPVTKGPSDGFAPIKKKPTKDLAERRVIEEKFKREFGFRDVRLPPADTDFANRLYDEMVDVAKVLNVPRTAFSGGGVVRLILSRDLADRAVSTQRAIKTRGPWAMYIPETQDIIVDIDGDAGRNNALTAFFHEWFHYLDHTLFHGTSKPTARGLLTSNSDDLTVSSFARPDVSRAIDGLMRTIYGPEILPMMRRGDRLATIIQQYRQRYMNFDTSTGGWIGRDHPSKNRDEQTDEYLKRDATLRSIEAQVKIAEADLEKLNKEVEGLIKKGKASKFFADSVGTGQQYFYSPWEMAARSFQLYVATKVEKDDQLKGIDLTTLLGPITYPTNFKDASSIFAAFDNLFATLKTRPGVRGYELYSLGKAGDVDRIRGLYNPLIRSVENLKVTKAPASQWLGTLFEKDKAGKWRPKGGALKDVRTEIIDWTGIIPWLEAKIETEKAANKKESISKEDVLDFLKLHDVVVTEVWNDEGSRPPRPTPPEHPRAPSVKGVLTPEQRLQEHIDERSEEAEIKVDNGKVDEPDPGRIHDNAIDRLEDRYGHWADNNEDELAEFEEEYGFEDAEAWVMAGDDLEAAVRRVRINARTGTPPLSQNEAALEVAKKEFLAHGETTEGLFGPMPAQPDPEKLEKRAEEILEQITQYESLFEYAKQKEEEYYYQEPDVTYTVTITQGDNEWTERVHYSGGEYFWDDNYESGMDDIIEVIRKKYLDDGKIEYALELDDDEQAELLEKFTEEYNRDMEGHEDVLEADKARYERERAEYAVLRQQWQEEVDRLALHGQTRHHRYTPEPKLPQKDYFELKLAMPDLDGSFVVSSHFNHNNIVVHARFFHYTAPDGRKYLVLGEVQTDLIQQIEQQKKRLKKAGRGNEEPTLGKSEQDALIKKRNKLEGELNDLWSLGALKTQKLLNKSQPKYAEDIFETVVRNRVAASPPPQLAEEYKKVEEALKPEIDRIREIDNETEDIFNRLSNPVLPNAPFRQESKGGLTAAGQVMLKRMLRWAVDHGLDGITWTTGAQQAMIYGRSTTPKTLAYRWTEDGKLDVMNSHQRVGQSKDEARLERLDIAPRPIPEFQARLIFGDDLVEVMKASFGQVGNFHKDKDELAGSDAALQSDDPALETGSLHFNGSDELSDEEKASAQQWRLFDTTLFGDPPVLSSEGQHLQYDVQFRKFWAEYLKPWGGRVEEMTIEPWKGKQRIKFERPVNLADWDKLFGDLKSNGLLDGTSGEQLLDALEAARDNASMPMPAPTWAARDIDGEAKNPVIYITPKMREEALKGQPLKVGNSAYQVRGEVDLQAVEKMIRKMIPDDWSIAQEFATDAKGRMPAGRTNGLLKTIFVAMADKGVARHEVVHVLREIGAIPKEDWSTLLEASRERDWRQKYKIDERYGDLYADAFPDPDVHEEMLNEEAIGHAFGNEERHTLFERIRRVLARIRAALTGKPLNLQSFEDIFKRIESGAYLQNASPSIRGTPNLYLLGDEFKDGYMAISAEARKALNDRVKLQLSRASTLSEKWKMWKELKASQTGLALQKTRLGYQDYFLGFKRLQAAAAAQHGVTLEDAAKPYLAEELFHKKQEYQIELFNDKMVEPFVKELAYAKEDGVSLDDLDIYLYARHAEERNVQIAEINPTMPDGGSGMMTKDAKEILKQYAADPKAQARLDSLAKKYDAMNEARLDLLVKNGLMKPQARATMKKKYKHYASLKGLDTGGKLTAIRGLPQGFSVGSHGIKRALGRRSAANDITSRAIVDYYEAVVRTEKNRPGQALYELLTKHPMEHVAVVDKPKMVRYLSKASNLEVEVPVGEDSDNPAIQKEIVKERPDPLSFVDPMTVSVMIDGERHHIRFMNQDLADAFRSISGQEYPMILQWLRSLNRMYSLLLTSLNPEFQAPNFARDIQAAGINMAAEDVKKGVRKLVTYAPQAMNGIMKWNANRDSTSEWAKLYDELQKEGGTTGFYTLKDWATTTAELKKEIATAQMKSWRWGRAKRVLTKMASTVNDVMENSTRLAAYKIALDNGATKSQAASFAKNITVNFNRHGNNKWLSWMYIFANPNIQGNTRMAQAMLYGKHGRKLMGGLIGMGALMTIWNIIAGAAMAGDDEENLYTQIPDYVRENNFIIMMPVEIPGVTKRIEGLNGRYINRIMIPMPYGYSLFYNFGRRNSETYMSWATDWAGPPKDPVHELVGFLGDVKGAFSPIGTHEHPLVEVMPTVLKPFSEIGFNTDFTGSPVVPPEFKPEMPDFHRVKRGTSPVFKDMAEWMNDVSGGDTQHPGWMDVSPEEIKHVSEFAAGGLGKFVLRNWYLGEKFLSGEPIHFQDIPIARRFAGGDSGMHYADEYFELDTRMSQYENARKAAAKGSDADKALLPELRLEKRLFTQWKSAEARLKVIRTKQKNLDLKHEEGTVSKALYDKTNNVLWDQRQLEQMRLLKAHRIEMKRMAIEGRPYSKAEKAKQLAALAGEERRAKKAFDEMAGDAKSEKDTRVPSGYQIDWGKLFDFAAP